MITQLGTLIAAGPVATAASTPQALTPTEAIGIYAGIPIGLFVVITILALTPSWIRGRSYRPGASWWAAPQWFGERPSQDAVEFAREPRPAGDAGRAGDAADAGRADDAEAAEPAEGSEVAEGAPAGEKGGAGARW